MRNDAIEWFYSCVKNFVDEYIQNINHDYTGEKIEEVIKNIPKIIEGFSDPTTEEEYRSLAKQKNGTLAAIQITDPKTKYKLYRPINSEEYKSFYFECLMYSLVYYELFFNGWVYEIADEQNGLKSGGFEITEFQLPHLLGIDAKYVGESSLMSQMIEEYNGKSPIEQILLIIKNYEKIREYEDENEVDIFNYYKSMQKVKEFLLLGRFFNEYRTTSPNQNKLVIVDNEVSCNQLFLYKKSNMGSMTSKNIIKLIIQLGSDGNFFARSLQSVSEDMEAIDQARRDLSEGVRIWEDLPSDIRGALLSRHLIFEGIGCTVGLEKIKLNERQSMINPYIFRLYEVNASHIKEKDLIEFLELAGFEILSEFYKEEKDKNVTRRS